MDFEVADGATPLDPDEAADLIPTHVATMGDLNEWEQLNILGAEEWVFGRKRRQILTEPFVRTLHRRMFGKTWKWAGQYRQSDKNIGVHWRTIPTAVRQVCDNSIYWVENKVFDIDEIAARVHHDMVAVHPFPNGNGRQTRLLADALLFVHERPRFTWGSASPRKDANEIRVAYLGALRSADRGDFAPLLTFART